MKIQDIKEIILLLPTLIIYIVPGYIIITFHYFITAKKASKESDLLIKSLAISFVLINIEKVFLHTMRFIFGSKFGIYELSSAKTIIITIIFGAVSIYVIDRILLSLNFQKFLHKLGIHKYISDSVLENIVDIKFGNWIIAYLPAEEVIYTGKLRLYEGPKENMDYFIVLSNYSVHSYDGEELQNCNDDDTRWVSLNMKRISRTEIVYSVQSKNLI